VFREYSFESIRSDKTFRRLQSCLEECETRHIECGKDNPEPPDSTMHLASPAPPPNLPTRVLDIVGFEKSSVVKLYVTKANEQSRYIALSYCWGGQQRLTTTLWTLAKRVKGIPKSRLPQTIRDAIEVTQRLGFRYLWVDSLCIIQDSQDDMRAELAMMGEVYKNATITLAAGNAKSVEEGFLSERPYFPKGVPLPISLSNQSVGTVYFRSPVDRQPLVSDPVLFTRGWAFQEFLLSSRVILFDCFGVTWNCNTASFKGLSDIIRYKVSPKLSFSRSIQLLKFNVARSKNIINSGWSTLISEYSARDFSCFEDRLPAIAGIAKEFSLLLNDEYLAGLWRKELIWTLGWQKRELYGETLTPFQHLKQGRIGSPSWSWKTAPFPVSVPWWHGHVYTLNVEMISYKITLSSEDSPFGDVVEGVLMLRAKVLCHSAVSRDGIRLDYLTDIDKLDGSTYCLLLGMWNKDRDPDGLVVHKLKDGSFERIGFFRDRSCITDWGTVNSEVVTLR
jgi:Heterokaryon incompatibility protein (HET)